MTPEEFAEEVHRRLNAVPDKDAVENPHGTLMRIARQVAFQHPYAWCKEIWLGRHARKALRDRMRKERESNR